MRVISLYLLSACAVVYGQCDYCGPNTECVDGMCESACSPVSSCCAASDACDDASFAEACVCTFDPYCCNTAWDNQCVSEAKTSCAMECDQSPTPTGPTGLRQFAEELETVMATRGYVTEGEVYTPSVTAIQDCMNKWSPDLLAAQNDAYNSWVKGQFIDADQHGSKNPNFGQIDNTSSTLPGGQTVYSLCNTISNIPFYDVMVQVACESDANETAGLNMQSFVESASFLSLGSSLMHGSWTAVGQLADNLGIDVTTLAAYEMLVDSFNVDFSNPACVEMKTFGGPGAAVLAKALTDLSKEPINAWIPQLEILKALVPSYKTTVLALSTLMLHTSLPASGYGVTLNRSLADNIVTHILDSFQSSLSAQEYVDITDQIGPYKELVTNCTAGLVTSESDSESFDRFTYSLGTLDTLLRALSYQGDYGSSFPPGTTLIGLLEQMPDFIDVPGIFLSDVLPASFGIENSVLPSSSFDYPGKWDYPGKEQCEATIAHSMWHSLASEVFLKVFELSKLVRQAF